MNRILIVSNNSTMPYDAAQQVGAHLRPKLRRCRSCAGDGWVIGEPYNPSDPVFRMTCEDCEGEGFIEQDPGA